jgi:nucleoside-diphosphate-sugar epimerase
LACSRFLFDWIRDGRRIYVLGNGSNRYQLLAVEDLVDAVDRACTADVVGEVFNVGSTIFGTVRSDLEALIRHAAHRLTPAGRSRRGPRSCCCADSSSPALSPLGEWHYKTASRDSFVDVSKAESLLGWRRRSPTSRRSPRTTTGTRRTAGG